MAADVDLRHGYTLADLHALARLAVHAAGLLATSWHDRYEIARSAIAEHLYAAEYPPERHDLVRAGRLGIYAVVDGDRQVEQLSLAQILPLLTPRQREALAALAAFDDYHLAAEAIGATYVTFKSNVARARARFLALWHEGEAPSRPWGCDRRAGRAAGERRTGGTRLAMEAIRRRGRARQDVGVADA